ncbi:MAG: hypothetical protein J5I92_15235 [Thiogranum sp.]|nr:hypothetical protein [Thiogranum sp.]
MTRFMRLLCLLAVLTSLAGCAGTGGGLNSASKTNELAPGMDSKDVKDLLGEPSQTQFISEKWVWKYSLHQPWKGFVPYYLVFDTTDKRLESWYADEAEYHRQQQLWMQAMPPVQNTQQDSFNCTSSSFGNSVYTTCK